MTTTSAPLPSPKCQQGLNGLPPIVLVLGGPGSGKGTQCVQLANEFGFVHLSTGDLLRKEVELGTNIGTEAATLLASGELVSDEIVMAVLGNAVRKLPRETKGVLVDGFPRSLEQAKLFNTAVGSPHLVLYFHCPQSVLRRRMAHRGRLDDNLDAIAHRLHVHDTETPAVLTYFSKASPTARLHRSSSPESMSRNTPSQQARQFASLSRRQQRIIRIPATPPADVVYRMVRTHFLPGGSFEQGRALNFLPIHNSPKPIPAPVSTTLTENIIKSLTKWRRAIQTHPTTTATTAPIGRPVPTYTHASPLRRPVLIAKPCATERPHTLNPRLRMGQTLTIPFYLNLLHVSSARTLMRRRMV
ncbi:adenylate kinase [Spizellomyces sp. 'palustris']|nr:adenylate kinase [Spizellomyces sp. 'palustris']